MVIQEIQMALADFNMTLGYKMRTGKLLAIVLCVLLSGFFIAPPVMSADILTPEMAEKTITSLETSLTSLENSINREALDSQDKKIFRIEIEATINNANSFRDGASDRARQNRELLAALGPPPKEGEQAENAEIAKRREELRAQLANSEGRVKRADLIKTQANLLLSELTQASRAKLTKRLLQKSVSPITLDPWPIALQEFFSLSISSFVDAPVEWTIKLSKTIDLRNFLLPKIAVAILIGIMAWPARNWLLRRYGRVSVSTPLSYARRVLAGLVEGAANGLVPVLFVLAVWYLVDETQTLGHIFGTSFSAICRNLVIFFIAWGLISSVLAPKGGDWRITSLSDLATRSLARRLKLAITVFISFQAVHQSFSWATLSPEFESVFAFIFMLTLYPISASIMQGRLWELADTGEPEERQSDDDFAATSSLTDKARRTVALALIALPVTAGAGYPELAIFLARAAIFTGIIVGVFWLVRWLKSEAVTNLLNNQTALGRVVCEQLGISRESALRTKFWIELFLDLVLLFITGTVLLPLWGFGTEETAIWISQLFRGVQIGSFTFSLSDVLVAIGLFSLVLVVTRLLQRGMERYFLPNITRDQGVRDALKTGVGYVGAMIAGLVGISALGIDLSNLALVVGALSVGIGFGLQNVVNNFVSGLILLIERPIKQGDWVIIGGHEGTVKKINVRSTEVETFQRASVIIPNADLIATPVINWTHKNVQGRVEVLIGVAYGSDVEQVRDILLEIGRSHPDVMKYPEPSVLFKDFGASSLDFELRCYLHDILKVLIVGSDLRYSIDAAFREHKIEIPFPQRVVHLAGSPGSSDPGIPTSS